MVAGDVRLLIATIRDAAGTLLTGRATSWISSNLSVVNGTTFGDIVAVTALAPGVATVTATVEGKSASTTITVAPGSTSVCATIAGASVFGDDGQYLGRFTNQFDSQSILNTFSNYGSQFSATSTNNTFGTYGSAFSNLSARNSLASRPPSIVKNNQAIAFYTTNALKTPGVSPAFALTCNFP